MDPAALPPLHVACVKGDLKLLEAKADANASAAANWGITPLQCACGCGELDVAKLLFEHGAHANKANDKGNTPLHAACACANGHVAVAKLMLEHGADKDTRDATGATPLFLACDYWTW
jgi:ankyrin repeat protein